MSRRPDEVREALATAAGLVAFDAEHTWRDVVFGPDGVTLSRPSDPDRALLTAVSGEYPHLDAHGDTLAQEAHRDWLERILGVPRLPVLADTVVAHATVDPATAPAVIPRGAVLRGGKDAFGAERRYATTDALTAHGSTVTGVLSVVPGGHDVGRPGLVAADPLPLDPTGGQAAPHRLRLYSPVLAFDGGDMEVQVAFTDAGSLAALTDAQWAYPTPDGAETVTTGAVAAGGITVELTDGCVAADGDPWLEMRIPPDRALPTSLGFTGVTLAVTKRTPIVPEAAYLNDGALDPSKEFQPFGPAAKRGDALYLRSDEAFGKPLDSVSISVEVMSESAAGLSPSVGGSGIPGLLAEAIVVQLGYLQSQWGPGAPPGVQQAFDTITGVVSTPTQPKVEWQRRVEGTWQTFKPVGAALTGFTAATVSGDVCSEPAVIGGQRGHLVRAFLSEGDFGWTDYQEKVAAFATEAVSGGTPTMPTPPVPPVVSRVALHYTTKAVAPSRVAAVNGWATTTPVPSQTFHPFTDVVTDEGHTGMVAIGLDLPDAAIGGTVSVYLGVESASPCGSSPEPENARWQWWDGTAWQTLAVADGSRMLRESGLLRFVAPAGWPHGCAELNASDGRWLRMITGSPGQIGVIRAVTPDAVLATYVNRAPDPTTDPSPATALPTGTIKGLLSPVTGVKKVTNVAGRRGRGPEDDDAYRRRASALTRHRGRSITAWDHEEVISVTFPEVAAVLCLPHTGPGGVRRPGGVGLVVLPDRPDDPAPSASVSLAGRISAALSPMGAVHARTTVLCPEYAPVRVETEIVLQRGVAALTGREAILRALELWLHPGGSRPVRWGRGLYRSVLVAFLDGLAEVDTVGPVTLRGPNGLATELVEVDPCRGLYCSSVDHSIAVEEQL